MDSYKWVSGNETIEFHALITAVAGIDPRLRVRFTTSHPKDLSEELLKTMAEKTISASIFIFPFRAEAAGYSD